MIQVAFATSTQEKNLTADDRLLVDKLTDQGVQVRPIIWDQVPADKVEAQTVIIRSCWDYHLKSHEFSNWVHSLSQQQIEIWNPPAVIHWNIHKKYLLDLHAKGVRIPKTVCLPMGAESEINQAIDSFEGRDLVIKPAISLSGVETAMFRSSDLTEAVAWAQRLLVKGDILIQEFLPEIQTEGELSFLFFGNELSHVVRKRAAAHEFRIQEEYGGTRERVAELHPDLVKQARYVLKQGPTPLLYARVDGVVVQGAFHLMELEIIDPALFVRFDAEAASRFVKRLRALGSI